jgi:hypothetical protein
MKELKELSTTSGILNVFLLIKRPEMDFKALTILLNYRPGSLVVLYHLCMSIMRSKNMKRSIWKMIQHDISLVNCSGEISVTIIASDMEMLFFTNMEHLTEGKGSGEPTWTS